MKLKTVFANILIVAPLVIIQGCSLSSAEVMPEHVSGFEYKKMTCDELEGEIGYLQRAANEAAGVVDQRKTTQDAKDGAALVFLWPLLFITDTNGPEVKKYATLKGEYEAAKRSHRRKGC